MKKERIHVLVVEDEAAHAELIRRAFEPQSDVVRISVAKNLDEARASLTESLPDLAIVDLFLPDGRGLELLEEQSGTPDYPVVIVTSHGDEKVAVEAMKAGALQYVVKSEVALAELPHKVETALRQWGHIVERKQAESALQASEEHFRCLIENTLDVITVLDERRGVSYTSPSFTSLFGFAAQEWHGRDYFELIHEEDQEAVAGMIEQARNHPPTGELVFRHLHSDGSWRFLEAVGSSYEHSADGRLTVVNARDVTDRKRTEAEKQALANRLRHMARWETAANLSGDIAREFNEMLNPILDYATLTLQQTPEGSKARAGLERVLTAASRARAMAEQIFIFSRRTAPRAQPLQLCEIVESELDSLRSTLPDGVELKRHLDAGCRPVMADPEQMREILHNIFSNAVYAMREGGGLLEVRLESRTGGDDAARVRLTVRDTGHGMDAETRKRALEAFFTTKTVDGAVGLGLSVAHAIVASHGGDLDVISLPGEGTTIRIDLPCEASS